MPRQMHRLSFVAVIASCSTMLAALAIAGVLQMAHAQTRISSRSALGNAVAIQARGSSTPLQLQDWLGFTVNVRAFGAVGDGVADDSVAIQNAINSVPANGGEVYFPPGTYLVNTTITSTAPSLSLRGAGGGGWNVGAATRIVTTAAIIVFDFGTALATEHKGVHVTGLSVNDSSSAGAGGLALGAFRIRRQNHVRFDDVSINQFGGGYGITFDGTGDAIILPLVMGVRARATKFGVVQVGVVTTMWLAPTTYFTGPSPNTGSVGVTLTGDTSVVNCAIDQYETGIKITGDEHRIVGARLESNALHIWVAGPTARRNIIANNSISAGGTTASVQIDSSATIFDTIVANNAYAAPAVGIVDNSPVGSGSYIFEPQQNLVRIRRTQTGSVQWAITNMRQNGAATDLAELLLTSNGLSSAVRAGADGTLTVGSTTNNNFSVMTNGATSATFVRDAALTTGNAGLLIRTNTAGTLRLDQVSVSIPDSGGTGFRTLRVPN